MDSDDSGSNELDRLRAERDEWRRRAEVAEAVAVERLARAEAAERALTTAEVALGNRGPAAARPPGTVPPNTVPPDTDPATDASAAAAPPRPRSLLERWRRYTDTIN